MLFEESAKVVVVLFRIKIPLLFKKSKHECTILVWNEIRYVQYVIVRCFWKLPTFSLAFNTNDTIGFDGICGC